MSTSSLPFGFTTLGQPVGLRCPQCKADFGRAHPEEGAFTCTGCGFEMRYSDGIWHALPAERLAHYEQFIRDYEAIRAAEHRGSYNATYYLQLPSVGPSDSNAAQWKIRARTYGFLKRCLLPHLVKRRAARILDIGAGNCWLSYRLAQAGMQPIAVDLLINNQDGLGAARHYDSHVDRIFPRVRADCNALPFADAQFDLVIFNASFHYAEDYERVLSEALRCLLPDGRLLITDSPWYAHEESGKQMLVERRAWFSQRFGTPSDSLTSEEFLTNTRLEALARACQLTWKYYTPFYGLKWSMRPLLAKLSGRREPSTFRIYLATKAA